MGKLMMPEDVERFAPEELVPRTKTDATVSMLKDAIYSGRYTPGEKLSQNRVAKELGLSPTPVREAFRILLAQGLVRQRAHHSVEVTRPDLGELKELYHVRALLEAEAVRLAARNLSEASIARLRQACRSMRAAHKAGRPTDIQLADEFFHRSLYENSGNRPLVELIGQLWGRFPRHMLWIAPGRLEQSIEEHFALVEALEERRPAAAAKIIRLHLGNALRSLEATLSHDSV